jgi:hypothetical protein
MKDGDKSLGQIAFEAFYGIGRAPHAQKIWENELKVMQTQFHRTAAAVEREVLRRLKNREANTL